MAFLLGYPDHLDRLIPYRPCASGPTELAAMQTELDTLAAELPGQDLGFAAPGACSDVNP